MPPETTTDTATGATPGGGATPSQAGAAGANAGAMPAAAAGTKPAAADDSATDDSTLGESGKTVLRDARRAAKEADDRAKAAETELAQLREAGQSDSEKAITGARREAANERDAHWKARIRAAEVRGALRGAGIANDEFLDLALSGRQFRDLKVDSETGAVEGLPEAIESFKKAVPEAFGSRSQEQPGQGGAWGGSEGGNGRKEPGSLSEALADHYAGSTRR